MGISDLEAVLFSAAKPISIDVIQDIFKLSKQDSLTLIDHLASDLESHKRGIRVRISAAGVDATLNPFKSCGDTSVSPRIIPRICVVPIFFVIDHTIPTGSK